LREAGTRVPDDVAVRGFDDMPGSARSNPPLSTVRQPVQRTGMVAAETLIDMTSHPNGAPRRIILPTELIIRASCGYGHRKSGATQPRVAEGGPPSLADGSTALESA
jgi:LacI family transcriptional regulator